MPTRDPIDELALAALDRRSLLRLGAAAWLALGPGRALLGAAPAHAAEYCEPLCFARGHRMFDQEVEACQRRYAQAKKGADGRYTERDRIAAATCRSFAWLDYSDRIEDCREPNCGDPDAYPPPKPPPLPPLAPPGSGQPGDPCASCEPAGSRCDACPQLDFGVICCGVASKPDCKSPCCPNCGN